MFDFRWSLALNAAPRSSVHFRIEPMDITQSTIAHFKDQHLILALSNIFFLLGLALETRFPPQKNRNTFCILICASSFMCFSMVTRAFTSIIQSFSGTFHFPSAVSFVSQHFLRSKCIEENCSFEFSRTDIIAWKHLWRRSVFNSKKYWISLYVFS